MVSMASKQSTVDFITEQIADAGMVTSRKMFGEYAIYCEQRVVALVCDDKLYVKPTDGGRTYISDVVEKPPYPGAQPYFLISEDYWDDKNWLTELIRITTTQVPLPKKKQK